MPDNERMVIEATRLGLAANASKAEIVEKIHGLADELKVMTADRDTWRSRAEEMQAEVVTSRRAVSRSKELEGELLIQSARDLDKIDEAEVEFYKALWKDSPELCKKRLEGLRERRYLRTQESLKGTVEDPPDDPTIELQLCIAEVRAANKDLTEAQAANIVYAQHPGLKERVLEQRRSQAAQKEGAR